MAANPRKDFHTDLAAIRSDIAELTESVGRLANETAKAQVAMAATVKKAANGMAGVGEEMWDEATHLGRDSALAASDAAHTGVSNIGKRIKANPLSSVLIALGVGFLVGIIGVKRT